MIKRINIFLLWSFLISFLGIILVVGFIIKIPNYLTFTAFKNGRTATFYSDCCDFQLGEKVSIRNNSATLSSKGTITNIVDTKIYIEIGNADFKSHILLIQYNKGSISLFEKLFKEILKI